MSVKTAGTAIALVFQAIVLSWILKIEKKCDCSRDWRRDYMKYFSIIAASTTVLGLFMPNVLLMLGIPMLIAGLVNIAAILSYIPALKKRDCTCALEDEWRDNFIFWWVILSLVASTGAVLMLARK